jgi:hypothetical protein
MRGTHASNLQTTRSAIQKHAQLPGMRLIPRELWSEVVEALRSTAKDEDQHSASATVNGGVITVHIPCSVSPVLARGSPEQQTNPDPPRPSCCAWPPPYGPLRANGIHAGWGGGVEPEYNLHLPIPPSPSPSSPSSMYNVGVGASGLAGPPLLEPTHVTHWPASPQVGQSPPVKSVAPRQQKALQFLLKHGSRHPGPIEGGGPAASQ